MVYSFRLSARILLNEPSRRQDSPYHDLAAARKDPPLAFFFFERERERERERHVLFNDALNSNRLLSVNHD